MSRKFTLNINGLTFRKNVHLKKVFFRIQDNCLEITSETHHHRPHKVYIFLSILSLRLSCGTRHLVKTFLYIFLILNLRKNFQRFRNLVLKLSASLKKAKGVEKF